MSPKTLTMSPADVLEYQREQVRTGNYLPLGRMNKISIGPNASYTPPIDPYIARFGRMIELRDRFLPIAQSPDHSMILVTSRLSNAQGQVQLPDVPDPGWIAQSWTEDEVTGKVVRSADKDAPRMIPQRLEDRTNERLQGTNLLVFQPVLRIAFQPELQNRLIGTAWTIECLPEPGGAHTAFLVDMKTGECFFFGGLYDIRGARGG